jgi:Flp pilus assembly protein TadD
MNRYVIRTLAAALMLASGCRPRDRTSADAGTILTARTLGLAYLEENRLPEAEEEFEKLIRLAPKEPSGHANLGLVYLRLGRYPDALRVIDRAVDLAPDDPDIRLLQATALRLTGRADEARRVLESTVKANPTHLKTLYALAELARSSGERRQYLTRLVEIAPANVAARVAFAEALAQGGGGEATAAREQLELLRQRLPKLPHALDVEPSGLARTKAWLELTPVYQASLAELHGPSGAPPGYPVLTLNARLALGQQDPRAVVNAIRFTDVTAGVGIRMPPPGGGDSLTRIAAGDLDGDQHDDLIVASSRGAQVYRNERGHFTDFAARGITGGSGAAAIGDYDNDGHLDLYAGGALYHNDGDGKFHEVMKAAGNVALFADLDHDGDLDLFVATSSGDRLFRNNGDGTFSDQTAPSGLVGSPSPSNDVALGYFDGDARVDLALARETGVAVYRGLEEGRFEAFASLPPARAIAAGDYNNDGSLDLFAGDFYRNDEGKGLKLDRRAGKVDALDAAFLDFDNDGWLDLIAATRARLVLLHNDQKGGFTDRSALLPTGLSGARQVVTFDFDDDGDLDLFVVGLDGRVHVLRNDGGNVNQFVKVALVALRDGSGKNNHFGIGSRVELRAGDLYEMRVVDRPIVHFGLGDRVKVDVLRVVWTNGVPQSFYYPGGAVAGTDRNMLEQQVLKGSCTFLYTWDGQAYRFLTDVTWASALGMPLGIMASGAVAYGPPQAAREYFKIAGERLKPRDGRYRMQLTEELWEVAYVDQLALLAVDHPDSVDVFVDERFVPPGSPASGRLQIHQVREKLLPRSATDERGHDLLPLLRAKDDAYVGGFVPGPYQGITQSHDLVLDLGPLHGARDIRLFLQGWLFPTDASINAAIAQSGAMRVMWPSLEVRDAAGKWRTVFANLSFPSGKDKTMIVDLTGRFLSDDHHVRIRTNMEIYWDHAFVAVGREDAAVRVTRLAPVAANLHSRGWSRMYRKGGRYGPQWFDYAQVSRESPWQPVGGHFTRYGDVLPLLSAADDQTVVIASGDEMSIEFPENDAPPLPAGWKRDFLLWNVAWMKDADLHTAAGQTVEPLPFHAATRYPYGPAERYPDDAAHRRYVAQYNTRVIDR